MKFKCQMTNFKIDVLLFGICDLDLFWIFALSFVIQNFLLDYVEPFSRRVFF